MLVRRSVVSSVIGDKSVAECRGSKQGGHCGCVNDRDGNPISNLVAFYNDHKGEMFRMRHAYRLI